MACESQRQPNQTQEERRREVADALARLSEAIKKGEAKVVLAKDGAVAFTGKWEQDRRGVSDACAVHALQNDFEFKLALQRAEALAGRKVDMRTVAAGRHSHDGGKTWHDGH